MQLIVLAKVMLSLLTLTILIDMSPFRTTQPSLPKTYLGTPPPVPESPVYLVVLLVFVITLLTLALWRSSVPDFLPVTRQQAGQRSRGMGTGVAAQGIQVPRRMSSSVSPRTRRGGGRFPPQGRHTDRSGRGTTRSTGFGPPPSESLDTLRHRHGIHVTPPASSPVAGPSTGNDLGGLHIAGHAGPEYTPSILRESQPPRSGALSPSDLLNVDVQTHRLRHAPNRLFRTLRMREQHRQRRRNIFSTLPSRPRQATTTGHVNEVNGTPVADEAGLWMTWASASPARIQSGSIRPHLAESLGEELVQPGQVPTDDRVSTEGEETPEGIVDEEDAFVGFHDPSAVSSGRRGAISAGSTHRHISPVNQRPRTPTGETRPPVSIATPSRSNSSRQYQSRSRDRQQATTTTTTTTTTTLNADNNNPSSNDSDSEPDFVSITSYHSHFSPNHSPTHSASPIRSISPHAGLQPNVHPHLPSTPTTPPFHSPAATSHPIPIPRRRTRRGTSAPADRFPPASVPEEPALGTGPPRTLGRRDRRRAPGLSWGGREL